MMYHNDLPFSTYDHDRDAALSYNCAMERGGWWHNACATVNLNGEYVTPGTVRQTEREGGMIYKAFKGFESLKISRMMFRIM